MIATGMAPSAAFTRQITANKTDDQNLGRSSNRKGDFHPYLPHGETMRTKPPYLPLISHGMPNLSVRTPKAGDQKVSCIGIATLPPSA